MVTFALETLVGLDVEAINVSGVGWSPVKDEETVTDGLEIRAWLLEIKKCLMSAKALCLPPGTRSRLEAVLVGRDDKLDLETRGSKIQ